MNGRAMRLRLAIAALAMTGAAVVAFATPASASPVTGTEHFLLLQTDLNGPTTVVGTGPIHAAGRDVQLSNTRDRFVFPKGTLIITHHPVSNHASFDPKTCLGRFNEHGTYQVARGTDAYAGASGSGTYHAEVVQQGCGPTPKQYVLEIHASGPLTIP
jgi:hypothetical protein